jgi:hypothetical protein
MYCALKAHVAGGKVHLRTGQEGPEGGVEV